MWRGGWGQEGFPVLTPTHSRDENLLFSPSLYLDSLLFDHFSLEYWKLDLNAVEMGTKSLFVGSRPTVGGTDHLSSPYPLRPVI